VCGRGAIRNHICPAYQLYVQYFVAHHHNSDISLLSSIYVQCLVLTCTTVLDADIDRRATEVWYSDAQVRMQPGDLEKQRSAALSSQRRHSSDARCPVMNTFCQPYHSASSVQAPPEVCQEASSCSRHYRLHCETSFEQAHEFRGISYRDRKRPVKRWVACSFWYVSSSVGMCVYKATCRSLRPYVCEQTDASRCQHGPGMNLPVAPETGCVVIMTTA
jgi:hypothetical protein